MAVTFRNAALSFFFTDPRYWTWLYRLEREIRQHTPMLFYTIWDDLPFPFYNRPYYESDDMLLCISKQTHNLVENVLRDISNDTQLTTFISENS